MVLFHIKFHFRMTDKLLMASKPIWAAHYYKHCDAITVWCSNRVQTVCTSVYLLTFTIFIYFTQCKLQ